MKVWTVPEYKKSYIQAGIFELGFGLTREFEKKLILGSLVLNVKELNLDFC